MRLTLVASSPSSSRFGTSTWPEKSPAAMAATRLSIFLIGPVSDHERARPTNRARIRLPAATPMKTRWDSRYDLLFVATKSVAGLVRSAHELYGVVGEFSATAPWALRVDVSEPRLAGRRGRRPSAFRMQILLGRNGCPLSSAGLDRSGAGAKDSTSDVAQKAPIAPSRSLKISPSV